MAEKAGAVTVYGLGSCDACRRAVRDLGAAGHTVQLVDVRAEPLDGDLRARLLHAFGDRLVNRRSATWRGLPEAQRAQPPDALLAAHPALMKRPVIAAGGALYLGWDAEARSALAG
jgi:arsenate reductase-like glutaredoxin family protein